MSTSLIDALIKHESDGDDNAVGDRGLANEAYGCLQIRQPVCDDVNRTFGMTLRAAHMLGQRHLSIVVFGLYMHIWATESRLGHPPSDEDRARIWNGGPNGWRAVRTLDYWAAVKAIMAS